jgi:hypothetical protein
LDTLVETAYRAEVSRVAAEQRRLAATRVTRFRFYSKAFHVECSAAEYAEWSTTQLSAPVWITTFDVKRWWWYLDRFWLDSEGLEAGPRLGLVLEEVESCAGPRIRSIHITGWA